MKKYHDTKKEFETPMKMASQAAFHEVKHNPPAIVKHTAKKFGKAKAHKQAVAIALSKARKAAKTRKRG